MREMRVMFDAGMLTSKLLQIAINFRQNLLRDIGFSFNRAQSLLQTSWQYEMHRSTIYPNRVKC